MSKSRLFSNFLQKSRPGFWELGCMAVMCNIQYCSISEKEVWICCRCYNIAKLFHTSADERIGEQLTSLCSYDVSVMTSAPWRQHHDVSMAPASLRQHHDNQHHYFCFMTPSWRCVSAMTPSWHQHQHGVSITTSAPWQLASWCQCHHLWITRDISFLNGCCIPPQIVGHLLEFVHSPFQWFNPIVYCLDSESCVLYIVVYLVDSTGTVCEIAPANQFEDESSLTVGWYQKIWYTFGWNHIAFKILKYSSQL